MRAEAFEAEIAKENDVDERLERLEFMAKDLKEKSKGISISSIWNALLESYEVEVNLSNF